MSMTPEERAAELLSELTLEEKIRQVTAEMIFDVDGDYESKRNPLCGSYRNPGHFMHQDRNTPASPKEVTERINRDVRLSIEAQPHGIPPIENGEALHGAQWGMCTNFPQPINLASSFNPGLVEMVADVIGKECSAAGVRQVFSPVVNLARDCRWGRTVETYGEEGGERQYKAAGFPKLYEDLKKAIKLSLGDEMELNLMKIDNSVI